jgi:hypothetical protein
MTSNFGMKTISVLIKENRTKFFSQIKAILNLSPAHAPFFGKLLDDLRANQ